MSNLALSRRRFLQTSSTAFALSAFGGAASFAQSDDQPAVIRFFGNPADYGQPYTTGILGLAHTLGFLEREFEGSGVQLEFTWPAGSGPAVNEAIANGQADFGRYGGFPNITGKARGLPTKLIASTGLGHAYLVASPKVKAETIADIRGLRVAVGRGTAPHLALVRALEQNGLSESDVVIFDIEGADEIAAVASGAVDLGWGGAGFLKLAKDGNAKLIYSSRGLASPASSFGGFVVTEDFAARFPNATQKVVNAYVRAAHFAAQPENYDAVLEAYSKAGEDIDALRADYEGVAFADVLSPLPDNFFRAQYAGGIEFAKENKLIRNDIDLDAWIDTSFIDKAVKDLGYEGTWSARNPDGSAA